MKSYYSHLKSRLEFGEKQIENKKPILRSSGIFPVIKNQNFSSRILFLGYWLIKRKISEINSSITLRNENGLVLIKKNTLITSAKSFTVSLDSLLKEINHNGDFIGSIEIEFNSTHDMVFPYPALVLEYFNEYFNTCVHTIQRIYNDEDDFLDNSEFKVAESGFDIILNTNVEPFLAFVNGPKKNSNGILNYTITNHRSQKYHGILNLGIIEPYETKFIKFNKITNLQNFLDDQSGTVSLDHNFEGFFPRFLVGNIQNNFSSVSFTHTYYDCSNSIGKNDYWNRSDKTFYDSIAYVPLFLKNDYYTNLILYPNLSPSVFDMEIKLFSKNGQCIFSKNNFLKINTVESKLIKISFNEIVDSLSLKETPFSALIITDFKNNLIPSRIKFGFDVGISNKKSLLPCNICFNSKLGDPTYSKKPGSFHWAPFFNKNTIVTLGNFSPQKHYAQNANLQLTIFREKDSKTLERNLTLSPNSEFRFVTDNDINSFLNSSPGWITIKSNNPNIQGFYFNFHSSGSVAGDHLF